MLLLAVSFAAAWLSKVLVEDPIRFRAPWAHGRTGAVVLLATAAALAALWALVPRPHIGTGSVDITQLTARVASLRGPWRGKSCVESAHVAALAHVTH